MSYIKPYWIDRGPWKKELIDTDPVIGVRSIASVSKRVKGWYVTVAYRTNFGCSERFVGIKDTVEEGTALVYEALGEEAVRGML